MILNIKTEVPFDYCGDCPHLKLREDITFHQGENGPEPVQRFICEHADFCKVIIKRHERAQRRSASGDSWYRENFTESAAYQDQLIQRLEDKAEEEEGQIAGLKPAPMIRQIIKMIQEEDKNGKDRT